MSEETLAIAPLIYVAGPYGDLLGAVKVDANISRAREATIWLAQHDFFFSCPHTNSAKLEREPTGQNVSWWYAQDLRLMEMCDAMIVVGDWTKSKGVAKELQVAANKGMPVFDFTDEIGRNELLSWREEWITKKLGDQLISMIGENDTEAQAI